MEEYAHFCILRSQIGHWRRSLLSCNTKSLFVYSSVFTHPTLLVPYRMSHKKFLIQGRYVCRRTPCRLIILCVYLAFVGQLLYGAY